MSIVYFGADFAYLVKGNAAGKYASMPRKSKKKCMRRRAHLFGGLKACGTRRNFSFLEEEGGEAGAEAKWRKNTVAFGFPHD